MGQRFRIQLFFHGLTLIFALVGCEGQKPNFDQLKKLSISRVTTELTHFRDEHGRYVHFNGVNVGGSTKIPYTIDPLSYIGRPFPLDEADKHFKQIRDLGFNSIRLLWIWEAVEPDEKGVYDEAFLDYFEQLIVKAEEHGLYVLINLHENLYSRHLFVRYNENVDWLYHSNCRDRETDEPDFSATCLTSADCPPTHICAKPKKSERNTLVDSVLSVFPRSSHEDGTPVSMTAGPAEYFSDKVQGDGAPLWAVKACLPEKDLTHRSWGVFKALGRLADYQDTISKLLENMGGEEGPSVNDVFVSGSILRAKAVGILPEEIEQATDIMPWSLWGLVAAISSDVQRCYGALFAGNDVFPEMKVTLEGGTSQSIQDYLQEAITNSWVEVAKRAAGHKNVIGYDLLNEPLGAYLGLAVMALAFQGGTEDAIRSLVLNLAGTDMGRTLNELIFGLNLLPPVPPHPDAPEEPTAPTKIESETDAEFAARQTAYEDAKANYDNTLYPEYQLRLGVWEKKRDALMKKWGLAGADLMGIVGMHIGFDKNYLQPFYERMGRAIQAVDPDAIIWIEESAGINMVTGGGQGTSVWEMNMTHPEGIDQAVFAPHWYPDIYPTLGFNVGSREFTAEEWEYRDWTEPLVERARRAAYSLGNIPLVYGEFGTYFNYNGIDWSTENDYNISAQILDNYYEAFESLNYHRMLWCYTADNDKRYGDKWNHEDFSIIDFNGAPRAEQVFNRPFARSLSGKIVNSHFYSNLHYFDPQKGKANEYREYILEMESKETSAPTEIHVPRIQYPRGFYVWLSDGYALYDDEGRTLYYFPTEDEPGHIHRVTIRAPQTSGEDIRPNDNWSYFFRNDEVIEGPGGANQ